MTNIPTAPHPSTRFVICGSWDHALSEVRGYQFHDMSAFSEAAGWIKLERNGKDRGHPHGFADTIVVCVGYPGKYAYARDAYRAATGRRIVAAA